MDSKLNWHGPAYYKILVKGGLGSQWSDWFDGQEITSKNGITFIEAKLVDQSTLHAILNKICELGLPLISVERQKE